MEIKVGKIPTPMLDPTYEDEWKPLDPDATVSEHEPLAVARTWGRSTTRKLKFA